MAQNDLVLLQVALSKERQELEDEEATGEGDHKDVPGTLEAADDQGESRRLIVRGTPSTRRGESGCQAGCTIRQRAACSFRTPASGSCRSAWPDGSRSGEGCA